MYDTHLTVPLVHSFLLLCRSFVDRDLLEPGCSVLTHNKVLLDCLLDSNLTYLFDQVLSIVGILADDTDPLVSVMKVDKVLKLQGYHSTFQLTPLNLRLRSRHMQTLEASNHKSRRSRRLLNCLWRIQNCTRILVGKMHWLVRLLIFGKVSSLPRASFCMDLQELARLCLQRLCIDWFLVSCATDIFGQAVANQTSATFLRIVGSELIQKYLGDGPKLVKSFQTRNSRAQCFARCEKCSV